jgi:hypothetical protein
VLRKIQTLKTLLTNKKELDYLALGALCLPLIENILEDVFYISGNNILYLRQNVAGIYKFKVNTKYISGERGWDNEY